MRVLRILLALVVHRLLGQVSPAQRPLHILPRRLDRILRSPRRVRTHIRNQPHRALRPNLHALIQTLRHPHRPPHIEPQPVRSILLQLARNIWSRGVPPPLLPFHARYRPRRLAQLLHHLIGSLRIRQRPRKKLLLALSIDAI